MVAGLLGVGSKAPDFVLPNQLGRIVQLSEYRGQAPVVLFFYPSDRSSISLRALFAFRASYGMLREHGAEVFGICADPIEAHRELALRERLPFALLSDLEHEVHGWYGIGRRFFVLPPRISFVIDVEGVVRSRCRAQFSGEAHARACLAALEELVAHPPPWPPEDQSPLLGL